MKIAEVAERIQAHLKKMEANPAYNERRMEGKTVLRLVNPTAVPRGAYVTIRGGFSSGDVLNLPKYEAQKYLSWLEAGNQGTVTDMHWGLLRANSSSRVTENVEDDGGDETPLGLIDVGEKEPSMNTPPPVTLPEASLFWLLQTLAMQMAPSLMASETTVSVKILRECLPLLTPFHAGIVVTVLENKVKPMRGDILIGVAKELRAIYPNIPPTA